MRSCAPPVSCPILDSSIRYMLDVVLGPEMCKARCFPPVALVWDPPYGLEVLPNLTTATVVVDSSQAIWGSSYGSEHTTIVLLADPHCAYDVTFKVSFSAAASRFLLVHGLQVCHTI
jgi:glycosylphosphatidylinositol deacylase